MDIQVISNPSGLANQMSKQEFGAQVVTKTMDYMNSSSTDNYESGMSQTYDFSKSVLGAQADGAQKMVELQSMATGKGKLTNFNI
jgi:hypothetical protein